jgi:hypothetical protein
MQFLLKTSHHSRMYGLTHHTDTFEAENVEAAIAYVHSLKERHPDTHEYRNEYELFPVGEQIEVPCIAPRPSSRAYLENPACQAISNWYRPDGVAP